VKITPIDIRRQEFAVKFRGYSPDEVHSYLEMVAAELEEVSRRNQELQQKVNSLEERVAGYTSMETLLNETLVNTHKAADETRAVAEKRADALISEARMNAEKIQTETKQQMVSIQREIADLRNQRDSFIINFRSLLDTQKSLLEMMEKRETDKKEFPPVRKKPDLSDEELDRVVGEFEQKLEAERRQRPDLDIK
jgi:cell division initiation protein